MGLNRGTVSNCDNTGDVSGTATGKGSDYSVGGVVGYNDGAVSNCDNTGDVSGTATGEYSDCSVGGVVGVNYGAVTDCYNTGDVSGTATGEGTNCYVGGVVGQNDGEDVSNCYYLSDTAEEGVGNDNSTAEAKDESFFEGEKMAEFLNANQKDSPWEYTSGNSAPTLKAFNNG